MCPQFFSCVATEKVREFYTEGADSLGVIARIKASYVGAFIGLCLILICAPPLDEKTSKLEETILECIVLA